MTVRGLLLRDLLRVEQADGTSSARTFRIREYQRDYAWTADDQVQALLDDLRGHFKEANSPQSRYVMGPMIVCPAQLPSNSSELAQLERALDFEVVDGQQRLTTLVLLLAAMRRDVLLRGSSRLLASRLEGALQDVEIVHHDHDVANLIRNLLSHDPLSGSALLDLTAQASRSAQNIAANFALLEQWARELYVDDTYLYNQIADGVLNSLMFAVTIAHDRALALLSFERANARGLDLDSTDLVKNLVFMREGGASASPESWSDLDERWKSARKRCEGGTPKLNFADVIRWHHDANDIGADTLSGAKLYRHISRSRDLPQTGSQYVDNLTESVDWITEIHRTARLPGENVMRIDGLMGLVRIRGRTQMKQHLPVLLAARRWQPDQFADLARSVEALMLVNTVCAIRPQVIEGVLRKALTQIRGDAGRDGKGPRLSVGEIVEGIQDEAGRLAMENQFAGSVKQLRYSSHGESQTIRYILERVDAAIRSRARGLPAHDASEYAAHWTRIGGTSPDAVREDLDHVWPKSDRINFPGSENDLDSTRHDQIGNLVLWFANGHRPSGATPASKKLGDWYGQDSENMTRFLLSPSSAQQDYSWARDLGLKVTTQWTTEAAQRLANFYVAAICEILRLSNDSAQEE